MEISKGTKRYGIIYAINKIKEKIKYKLIPKPKTNKEFHDIINKELIEFYKDEDYENHIPRID